ncbi:MAG: phosphodiesterase [Tardiphaga sp.]
MSSKPVIIAQITDLHIKAPGELAYGKVDTAQALARCIAELNAFEPRPDLVVISGDLVDTPTSEEYEHLWRLLSPLTIPFVAVPGNHDSREMMRAAFADRAYAHSSGALDQARPLGPLDIVALDSHVTGKPHGLLEPATLAWLDATLTSSSTRPALVFLHHPPFRTGIEHMDVQDLFNADELADIIRRHPRVRLVAAGHVHRATLTTFAGTAATICPAPNHAVDLDLGALRVPSFRVEPPAFHLHVWFPGDDGGRLVTHHVPIGDFDGPHPFFGSDGKLL